MAGTTTIDDEAKIADWFRSHKQVPSDLADYQLMFRYFDDGMPMAADDGPTGRRSARQKWLIALAAAAALALCIIMVWPSATDTPAVAALSPLPAATDSTKAATAPPTDTTGVRQGGPAKRPTRQSRARRYSLPHPKVYLAQAKADSAAAEATLLADQHVARMQREQEEMLLQLEIDHLLNACAIADMANQPYSDDEDDAQEY